MPGVPISVDISANPITGGQNFTATIILDQTISSDLDISLSVDNNTVTGKKTGNSYATLPDPVTVLAGNDRVTVQLGSHVVTTSTVVTITASANGGSAQAQITVNP